MKTLLPKVILVLLFAMSVVLGGLAQNLQGSSRTLDETPVRKAATAATKPLLDVPEPLRKLFPVIQQIEREVGFGQDNGDANALLYAVKNLSQAEYFTGIQGASSSSDRILRQATDIAWQQRDPGALRESLALWSSPARAGRSQEMILQTSERLEQVEKEREEMLERPRCSIIFHNRTERPVRVFVNRKPIGTLAAGETHTVGELLAGRQHLNASDETLEWGPRQVYVGPGELFNWRLFD